MFVKQWQTRKARLHTCDIRIFSAFRCYKFVCAIPPDKGIKKWSELRKTFSPSRKNTKTIHIYPKRCTFVAILIFMKTNVRNSRKFRTI